ncbi:MAG: hypothetical protein ACP5OG_00640 [Candidatus Nanoarchaeia archaeon]
MVQTQTNHGLCNAWQEQCRINFNNYNANKGIKSNRRFEDLVASLSNELRGKDGTTVINGGHYIPNADNQEIASNAIQTWEMACYTAKNLLMQGIDSKVSLIINDLPLDSQQRASLDYRIPKIFQKIANEYQVEIMNTSLEKDRPYSEKRCSNGFSNQQERKWAKELMPIEIRDHCKAAIIYYIRDIAKQGATTSIWITPKCSHKNLTEALDVYHKYEFPKTKDKVNNIAYFETNNCCL